MVISLITKLPIWWIFPDWREVGVTASNYVYIYFQVVSSPLDQ